MTRIMQRGLLSLAGGVGITILLAIFTTPLLWKLEPKVGIELAGHSGPSDWVLWLYVAVSSGLMFLALTGVRQRGKPGKHLSENN